MLGLLLAGTTAAQKKKKKKIKIETVAVPAMAIGSGTISLPKSEPFLGLEPCAKETPEQISELENAPDTGKQVEILLKRIEEKDDWLRSCAIYRLGEFRSAAQDALPVIVKLLRDEKNDNVWRHVEDALWKIPPGRNSPLPERIELAKSEDVYVRIFGVYSLSYFRPVPGSFQARDTLNALIEAAKDEDVTVCWLAVMGIRQLGFYGVNTADAIPVLSDVLKNSKINAIHPVRAFVPMGANALPAAPLLFDILYHPKKYVDDKDDTNARSHLLYLTAAIALGSIGKPLLPLLEKEFVKEPFAVLQVLGYISDPGVLPILFKAMNHQNPEVRENAVNSLPIFASAETIETIPYLLAASRDVSVEVRKSVISKIGGIARLKEKSAELTDLLKKKVFPFLIENLKDENLSCYSSLTLGNFGADAESAIPKLVNRIQKRKGDYCAEIALYDIGEKGRKYLTKEQIANVEESKKITRDIFNDSYDKAKPIKPKTQPTASPTPTLPTREG